MKYASSRTITGSARKSKTTNMPKVKIMMISVARLRPIPRRSMRTAEWQQHFAQYNDRRYERRENGGPKHQRPSMDHGFPDGMAMLASAVRYRPGT
jgi:hypothetical protein